MLRARIEYNLRRELRLRNRSLNITHDSRIVTLDAKQAVPVYTNQQTASLRPTCVRLFLQPGPLLLKGDWTVMNYVEVHSAGLTDKGLVRQDNQDQFLVTELTRSMVVRSGSLDASESSRLFGGPLGHLFFVADGMGGHKGGNEASRLAIQFFVNAVLNSSRWLVRIEPYNESAFIDEIRHLLGNAHRTIQSKSETDTQLEGMGTTLTLAYVAWPKLFVVHAGDTRCYLLRDGKLRLITRDHTLANQMMKAGTLDPSKVERSQWSNVLVNALGAGAENVFADVYRDELKFGDSLLLCSDGLNKHVSDNEICGVLLESEDTTAACKRLIQLAKQDGGSDNVTAVVASFLKPKRRVARMKIMLSENAVEKVFQDIAIPENDLDTMAEFDEELETTTVEHEYGTVDYPDDGTTSTQDLLSDSDEELPPAERPYT